MAWIPKVSDSLIKIAVTFTPERYRNIPSIPLIIILISVFSAHGEVHPLSKTPTPLPRKTSCRACGSPMFDEGNNMIMAFPPNFEFARTQSELDNFNKKTKGSGDDHSHGKGEEGGKQLGMPEVLKPGCHIFYERRVMDYIDGKTKWRKHKDTEEMGERERP